MASKRSAKLERARLPKSVHLERRCLMETDSHREGAAVKSAASRAIQGASAIEWSHDSCSCQFAEVFVYELDDQDGSFQVGNRPASRGHATSPVNRQTRI